ncbi:lecithin retinol acyltransferase family protein [Helicobacter ailurogastricus]|uniref:lecithin retinol acyltransferase family protein n=1 Tax=Helicobacter ailurogastricus TaxID=1578720 RepID=UPI0022C28581|nr:lecithin retinol acyltransferase family protein [Helicobacter ailurogastricus]GLH58118.1 hypothetical protein NHP214376_09070 [Helicobacter ailurogastricus]GLH58943.1 hypothetical protein NHP214377_02070 [Helicobacter ailurogastricus]
MFGFEKIKNILDAMRPTVGASVVPRAPMPRGGTILVLLPALYELAKAFHEKFIEKYDTYRTGDPCDGGPEIGSMVWIDLRDAFSHSGVYIGGGEIMHFTRKLGRISRCKAKEFSDGKPIFVSCKGKKAVGYKKAAIYAEEHEDEERDYDLTDNNCHGFVVECFTGNKQSEAIYQKPSEQVGNYLHMDCWRRWEWKK